MSALAVLVFWGLVAALPWPDGTWADTDVATGVFVEWGDHGTWPIHFAPRSADGVALEWEFEQHDALTDSWLEGLDYGNTGMAINREGWS